MHTSKMINLVLLLRLLRLLHSRLQSKARARKTGFARRETSRMIRFWEKGRANEAPAYTHTHTRQVSKYVRSYAPGEDLHEGIACVARGFLYVRTEHSAHIHTLSRTSRARVCVLYYREKEPPYVLWLLDYGDYHPIGVQREYDGHDKPGEEGRPFARVSFCPPPFIRGQRFQVRRARALAWNFSDAISRRLRSRARWEWHKKLVWWPL